MALGVLAQASFNEMLREDVVPTVYDAIPTSSAIAQILSNSGKNVIQTGGRFTRAAVRLSPNNSWQARGATGPIPDAGRPEYGEIQETIRRTWGSMAVTDDLLALAQDKDHAFGEAFEEAVDALITGAVNMENVYCAAQDGSGVLAEVETTPGAGAVTIQLRGPGTKWLNTLSNGAGGQRIAFYDGAVAFEDLTTANLRALTGAVIIDEITDEDTITIVAPGVAADVVEGDYVCLVGPGLVSNEEDSSAGLQPHGLFSLVDDGTFRGTLHNIVRADAPAWTSTIIRAADPPTAGIELDEGAGVGDNSRRWAFLQRLMAGVQRRSGGRAGDVLYTDFAGRQLIADMMDPDVRQEPTRFTGQYEQVAVYLGGHTMTLVVDKDAPHGMDSNRGTANAVTGRQARTFFWVLAPDAFHRIETGPPQFRDIGGSILRPAEGRLPTSYAQMYWRHNYVTFEPWRHGMLGDVICAAGDLLD